MLTPANFHLKAVGWTNVNGSHSFSVKHGDTVVGVQTKAILNIEVVH